MASLQMTVVILCSSSPLRSIPAGRVTLEDNPLSGGRIGLERKAVCLSAKPCLEWNEL